MAGPSWDDTTPVENKSGPSWDETQPAAVTPDIGTTQAAGRGAAQGLTFGFSDELRGLGEAGGLKPNEPSGLIPVVKGAYKYFTGAPGAEEAYNTAVQREHKANETAQEQHPYVYGGSEIAGALPAMAVLPEAGMARAPALLRPALKGAQVGAEYGALSGAGAGEDLSGRAVGTGVGAAAGAVGGAGGAALFQAIGSVLGPVVGKAVGAFNGWKDPEAEASRRLGAALLRDQEAIANGEAKGMTAQDWLAAKRAGEPVTLADLGSGNTQALLRSAGNTSPEAWAKLENTFNERFLGQSERVAKEVKDLVAGGANANKTADQIVAEYDAGRVPAYAKAFREGDKEIVSPVIERLMGSPTFEDAMKRAVSTGKDRAIAEGYGAFNPGVTVENGLIKFTKTNPKGVPQYPNLQYWDAVKRELDSMANVARRQGDTSSVAGNLATTLRGELDKSVPSYGNARGIASQYFNESNALEAGRKLAGKKVDPKQIVDVMRQMKPDERELFREGYASDWADRVISNISDTRDITKAMFNSPNERARALAVFGQAGLDKMQARMTLETIMQGAKNAMGNSTTAKQLIEAGLAGGLAGGLVGGYEGGWDPTHIVGGSLAGMATKKYAGEAIAKGAQKVVGKVDSKTASHVADLLTSNDITQMRKGLDLAIKNRAIMDRLRQVANKVALSSQSPATSAVASAVPKKMLTYAPHTAEQNDRNKPSSAGFARGGNVHNADRDGSGKVHSSNRKKAKGGAVQRALAAAKGYADGGAPELSEADQAAMSPETYANPFVDRAIRGVAAIPQRAFEASENYRQGGDYDPGPILDAAMLPMGTGAIAGLRMAPHEVAFGAGPIRAYHGSPHDFDAFDMSKIGTGEGAQAYGHGLYFAENEGVAKSYRDALAGSTVDSRPFNPGNPLHQAAALIDEHGNRAAAIDEIERRIAADPGDEMHPRTLAMLLHRPEIPPIKSASGKMYEVEINADPEHFLDWDKPLSQQPKSVQDWYNAKVAAGLRTRDIGAGLTDVIHPEGGSLGVFTKENLPDVLANPAKYVPTKGQDIARGSEHILREAGIPGIKYLDQVSRNAPSRIAAQERHIAYLEKTGAPDEKIAAAKQHLESLKGEGSRNYVLFNDKLVNILRKYRRGGTAE